MKPPHFIESLDLSIYRLTRIRVLAACSLLLATGVAVSYSQFSGSRDNVLQNGATVGGDYVVFFTAAQAAVHGRATSIYDRGLFEQELQRNGPERDRYRLTWQYPPTYLLVIAPLACISFIPGYLLWTGGTATAFFATLRILGYRGFLLFVILSAPSTLHAVITGQNGFLTASLLAVASLLPDRRPAIAGLAAATLTIKPQLGILLPIAYLAGGCWQALLWAAGASVVLAGASMLAFGPESWGAFLVAASATSDDLASGSIPLFKMVTPFAAARLAGLPMWAAATTHSVIAATAAFAVAAAWRHVRDTELRAGVLCAAVLLASPYAYYYELVVLALPAAILAKRAMESGWLPYEKLAIALAFLLPYLLPGEPRRVGVSSGVAVVLLIWISIGRRTLDHYRLVHS